VFGRKLQARFNAIEIVGLSPDEKRTQLGGLLAAMIEEIAKTRLAPDRWEAGLIDRALAHLQAGRGDAAYDAIATILVPLGARGRPGRQGEDEAAPKTLPELRSRLFLLSGPSRRPLPARPADGPWKRAT
jgi:hypothetical protein